jgi:hypothetical protein
MTGTVGAEPWNTVWAAQKDAEPLRYLRRNCPEYRRTCGFWTSTSQYAQGMPKGA